MKNLFLASRKKFYLILFSSNILILVGAVIILRIILNSEGENLLSGFAFAVIFIGVYIVLFFISIGMVVVYEERMTTERNKNKFLTPAYVLLFLSIIFWPNAIDLVTHRIGEIIEYSQNVRGKKYYDKMNEFILSNKLEECLKTFPETINVGGYTIDCKSKYALSVKDISLCPDRGNNCALEIIKKIKEEQILLKMQDKPYLALLCRSNKITPFYQEACLGSLNLQEYLKNKDCSDSDNGEDFLQKGIILVNYKNLNNNYIRVESDSCLPDGAINEWYCGKEGEPGGLLMNKITNCPNGKICRNGVCAN